MVPPLVRLDGISKRFPGVQALNDVSLDLDAGQIVGLVGENGAGKSTLLKILGGILAPDRGTLVIRGVPRTISNVTEAMAAGIHLFHQELNLAPNLNIAENIFLGRQPYRGPRWLPLVNKREMHTRAAKILRLVGLDVSPGTRVSQLSIAQQQLVEIAKALSSDSQILVFDEPTSSLSLTETSRLLELIENLKQRGVAILYVSHRLGEVEQLADRVEVLRDGRHVGSLFGESIGQAQMISLMVGRSLEQFFPAETSAVQADHPILEVRKLRYPGSTAPISFHISAGEIVSFAGLIGAGRTELACALFGLVRRESGQVLLDGQPIVIRSPIDALQMGIGLVPEDRKNYGLILRMSVRQNISLPVLYRMRRLGLLNPVAELDLARRLSQEVAIRSTSPEQIAEELSGGNQQKVVVAKWLATSPKLLILDEPTRGVDVGAKSEIYKLVSALASQGIGIMLISSEMEEVVGMSHRVIVMREGQITGEVAGDQINEANITKLAFDASNMKSA